MINLVKFSVKVNEFPEHDLPLLFSFPPGVPFDDSHHSLLTSNVLSIENVEGYTRVYSVGLLGEKDIQQIFTQQKKRKKSTRS